MAQAVICPICKGKGKLPDDGKCHGCVGKGWVEVSDDDWRKGTDPWYPWPVYPLYPYPYYPITWTGS